jgi:hypothetical protein
MRAFKAAVLTASLLALAACSAPQWKAYNYPAWGFTVSFKTPPAVTETASTATSPHSIQAEATQDGVHLVVIAIDSQAEGKSDQQLLADIPEDMVRSSGGTVRSSVNATADKVAGREITIDHGADPAERARVFVVKGRVYQVVTQTPDGSDNTTDAAQFLDSFHLTGR